MKKSPLILGCLLLFFMSFSFAGGSFFESLSFEKALAKAKTDNKVVFVDFYTTWCGPCKMLDRSTWKDERVIAWLKERTVPLKIDAEKEITLAKKYKITAYPSLVFIKPDGKKIDHLVGYRDAEDFLKDSEDALSGKDPLTRAKESLAEKGELDPQARMEYARSLDRLGKQAEALEHYLWCYDEGLRHSPSFAAVRDSFLLSAIKRLGRQYTPAMEALTGRRDQLERTLKKGNYSKNNLSGYAALNRHLGAGEKTLALYDRLKKEKPTAAKLMKRSVYSLLLEEKRFADIQTDFDLEAMIEEVFNRHEHREAMRAKKETKMAGATAEKMTEAGIRALVSETSDHYQVLMGLGERERGEKLVQRVLAFDGSANTYNSLAWSGYLSGKPTQSNLVLAEKANLLAGGKDAAVLDTLIRVKGSMGQIEEAIALTEKALPEFPNGRSRKILEDCLRDLRKLRQGEGS